MFERFVEQARKVVVEAQREAQLWWHHYIGTEHLLAGLLREKDGIGGQSLRALTSLAEVRQQIEALVVHGDDEHRQGLHAPFDPLSKKAMDLALREALQIGDKHIGTEHLLLGLTRTPEGNHIPILQALGIKDDQVRSEVFKRLAARKRTKAEDPIELGLSPELDEQTNKRIAVALESIAKSLERGWEMRTR